MIIPCITDATIRSCQLIRFVVMRAATPKASAAEAICPAMSTYFFCTRSAMTPP